MRRLRYLLAYRRLRRHYGDARRAWRGMTPEGRAVFAGGIPQPLGITAGFNPHDGIVDDLPYISKPTLFPGMSAFGNSPTGHAIAYLRWTLYAYSGYNVRPTVNWGPWSYSATVQQANYNTRVFFGLPGSYYCSEANGSWDLHDFLWAWNNQ